MLSRIAIVVASVALLVGCQRAGAQSGALLNPSAPSTTNAASPDRPWKASLNWTVTRLEWPDGQPPFSGTTSTFNGRCSQPSDYVIYASFAGEATHGGRFTGDGSHCSQLHLTPQGPTNITYSDGRGTLTSANGSTVSLRWGNGTSGTDPATGETWFRDQFTFAGGTGLFTGATGGGEEGGRFKDFAALLGGTPAPMTMEGTISYGPGNR
ncbi:MAG: hypothetical protein ACM3NQ_07795 [Bacteroidales bacterium]